MEIRQAKLHEASAVVMLVQALWPHHTTNELREELLQLLKRVDAAFFLAYHHECPVGYAHNASCAGITRMAAVPTLSGIWKGYMWRLHSVGRALPGRLLAQCEKWAKSCGCAEFTSDCELDNTVSLSFHLNTGFTEAGRTICFCKML